MNTSERQHTAVHEAGHVVAHFMFEERFPVGVDHVTISPTEDYEGRVQLQELANRMDPELFRFLDDDETNRECAGFTQAELEAHLCMTLAGEAATYILTGKRDDTGSGREWWAGDFKACMEFLERIFCIGGDPEAPDNLAAHHYLEALFWRTVVLLRPQMWWARVEALASALLERETLTGDECKAITIEAFCNL